MGASNAMAAFYAWAGRVPATSMQVLTYMALVSRDDDRRPWYGQGHEALAEHALGRTAPITEADIRAVERAITPLRRAGAIETDRHASVRRDGPSTARYRLVLTRRIPSGVDVDAPRISSDDNTRDSGTPPVDNQPHEPQRPTENDAHAPRNSDSRPTKSVPTPDGNRGTEEPRGTTRSEKTEEEVLDVRTDVEVSRATPPFEDRELSDERGTAPPAASETPPAVDGFCPVPEHRAAKMRGGDDGHGMPTCPLCRAAIRDRGVPVWLQDPRPGRGRHRAASDPPESTSLPAGVVSLADRRRARTARGGDHVLTAPLCNPCRDLRDRWLDTRPQDLCGLGHITQASAAYDLTPSGVADRRRARWERWRDLVVEQRAAIAATCRRDHQEAPC